MNPVIASNAPVGAVTSTAETSFSAGRRNQVWGIAACSLFLAIFLLMGFLMIPLLGLQTDEVMFVHGLWLPKTGVAWFSFYHHYLPSMLLSYVGGLKSWLYAPLLAVAEPTIWVVRVPVLLLAGLTIAMLGRLLWQIEGYKAAVAGVALLALDSTFLLTSVFDWGPVVLQNLLLVSLLLLCRRWYRSRGSGLLWIIGLLTGLALWNKALFIWNLTALLVAGLIFAQRQLREVWSVKRLGILLFGALLGCYPLLRYNLKHHGATMGENAKLQLSSLQGKARLWRLTLDGLAARDALIARDVEAPEEVKRPLGQVALRLANRAGLEFSSWGCAMGSILLAGGLWAGSPQQRRYIGFFLLSCLLAWAESALTVNAGTSIHHTCLFLIQWYCAVAIAVSAIAAQRLAVPATATQRLSWVRSGLIASMALLCVRSFVTVDVTYANLLAFDAHIAWTDADKPFVDELLRTGVKRVITADWGLSDVVTTRSLNRIAVDQQTFALDHNQFDEVRFRACRLPDCVVVSHVASRALFGPAQTFLKQGLARCGLHAEEQQFRDSHNQLVLTLLRLRSLPASGGPF